MTRTAATTCVLLALLACKNDKHETKTVAEPVASPAATPSTPAASSAPPSAAPEAPPKEKPLRERFAGSPKGVELEKRVTPSYPGTKFWISVPKGWTADTEQYSGMVALESESGDAMLFMHDYTGSSVKNVKFWSRNGFRNKAKIEWADDDAPGKFGADQIDAHFGSGTGTFKKRDADFLYARVELTKTEDFIAVAALTKEAPPERKDEAIAAIQSIGKKSK